MPQDDLFPIQIKVLEEVASKYHKEIKVGWVQEEFIRFFSENYGISGTPTFLLLLRGREKGRIIGVLDLEGLAEFVLSAQNTLSGKPSFPHDLQVQ